LGIIHRRFGAHRCPAIAPAANVIPLPPPPP
jgi:hypothetical protein